jgi:hypothetical protein
MGADRQQNESGARQQAESNTTLGFGQSSSNKKMPRRASPERVVFGNVIK